jgi:hypothetical protein
MNPYSERECKPKKGFDMKKMTLFLLIALLPSSAVFASDYIGGGNYRKTIDDCSKPAIYRELDNATRVGRAVTTVVICDTVAARPATDIVVAQRRPSRPRHTSACGDECGRSFERVVNREYFVKETREVYRPVVSYVPAGTYTTTRKVCENAAGC